MEPTAIPLEKLGIPPELARYVDASSPKEIKALAAKGLIPAPPRVLIAIQYCLLGDPDPTVAAAGHDGLMSTPQKIVDSAIDDRTHPKILEFFAFNRAQEEGLVESLLLKRQLNDRSICFLAERVSAKMLDIIAGNQERMLMNPAIFDHLKKNPNASKATVDRIDGFLRMHGGLTDAPAAPEPIAEAVPAEVAEVLAALAATPTEDLRGELEFKHGFEEEQDKLPDALTSDTAEKGDLWSTVSKLPMGQKIKLAFFGNASVRAILVRDSNKMVARAVMKSPRLTDSEVVAIAKNRNVCDDVLREIARNKEWLKIYTVKLALVSNPKTPVSISMPIVPQLMGHDLKGLASNKNVSSVISMTAKQMMNKKAH